MLVTFSDILLKFRPRSFVIKKQWAPETYNLSLSMKEWSMMVAKQYHQLQHTNTRQRLTVLDKGAPNSINVLIDLHTLLPIEYVHLLALHITLANKTVTSSKLLFTSTFLSCKHHVQLGMLNAN